MIFIKFILPFFSLFVLSFLEKIFFSKKNIFLSFILISILTSFFLFFFSKVTNLTYMIYFINLVAVVCLIYIFFFLKKKKEFFKDFFCFFFILFLATIISFRLEIYKFDDFSRYALHSKILYEQNFSAGYLNLDTNGQYIGIISYLFIFILKTFQLPFEENLLFIIQNNLIFCLIISILFFLEHNNWSKKIIFFIILYILTYLLCSGLDRLYLESILGLILLNLFLINKNFNSLNINTLFNIILLIIFLLSLKPSSIILFLFLSTFLIINSLKNKKLLYQTFFLIIFSFFLSMVINKYENNFKKSGINTNPSFLKAQIIKSLDQVSFLSNNSIDYQKYYSNNSIDYQKYFIQYFNESFSNGIYHAYLFHLPNKVLGKEINLKIKEIPLNIYFWFTVIIILNFFLLKKRNSNIFFFLSINALALLIFFYWIVLFLWPLINNQIMENFILNVSWERHLGVPIFAIFSLLLLKIDFQNNYEKKIFIITVLIIIISLPARIFLPFLNDLTIRKYYESKNIVFKEIREISNILKLQPGNNIFFYKFSLKEPGESYEKYQEVMFRYINSKLYYADDIRYLKNYINDDKKNHLILILNSTEIKKYKKLLEENNFKMDISNYKYKYENIVVAKVYALK